MKESWPALVSRDFQTAYDLLPEEPPGWLQLLSFSGRGWTSTISLDPFNLGKAHLSFALGDKERWQTEAERAKQELETWLQDPQADPSVRFNLATCYALLGDGDRMETVINEVREQIESPNWAYRRGALAEMQIAAAYIIVGEHDQALDALETASKMDSYIFFQRELKVWFIFDRLKGDPRYEALLE